MTRSPKVLIFFFGFLAGLTTQGVLFPGLSQCITFSTKSKEDSKKGSTTNSSSKEEDSRKKIYSCVNLTYPAGWGNTFLVFLLSVLKNARYYTGEDMRPKHLPSTIFEIHKPPVFPCVRGYGEVFGKLFRNVPQCPLLLEDHPIIDNDCYDQATHFPIPSGQWSIVRDFIWEELPKFQSLLQLNVTFVEEVFASVGAPFTLNELRNSSCAVHVQFGDAYF
jgi:hypothetical protein